MLIRKEFLFVLGVILVLCLSSALAAQEGLLHGTYGMHGSFVCVEPKTTEAGAFPPLPHFEMLEDGTSKLLVEAETTTYRLVGTFEFDGNGAWVVPEAKVLIVVHQRVSPGDVALQPLDPLSCQGTYTVGADRRVQGEGSCTLPVPGSLPLTLHAGPFKYEGFVGANPQLVILADVTPEIGLAEVKLSNGLVITSYEGFCSQSLTLVKIDQEPIHFAQFGNGGGLVSDIVMTNPTQVPATGKVAFSDDDGVPLPVGIVGGTEPRTEVDFSVAPLGATTVTTDGQGIARPGSALVTADQDLGGVIRFTLEGIGVAGVGQSQPTTSFIAPVRRKLGGVSTGLALENVEDHPVSITLSLRDESGQEVATRTLNDFPARGHSSQFIEDFFPGADTSDFTGTVTVRVNGGRVAGTAIELDVIGKKFTTLPVTPLA